MAKLEESDSNDFMDSAISVITYYIKQRYNDTIQLPDLREAIRCSVSRFLFTLFPQDKLTKGLT